MTRAAASLTAGARPRPAAVVGRPGGHPDAGRLAAAVARAYLEVLAGRRPLEQLSAALAPRVVDRVRREARVAQRARIEGRGQTPPGPGGLVVRRVVACWPAHDACETTVVVRQAGRTTAIAMRLERHHGAWRVVELAGPEAGYRAMRTASVPVEAPVPDAFDEVAAEAPQAPVAEPSNP